MNKTPELMRPCLDASILVAGLVQLFASEPHLPQHILDLFGTDELAKKAPSIFHYLYVVATGPAFGAENNVIAYRFRSVEEREMVFRAFKAGDQEIHNHHITMPPPVRRAS
jgi:hypothetical protein